MDLSYSPAANSALARVSGTRDGPQANMRDPSFVIPTPDLQVYIEFVVVSPQVCIFHVEDVVTIFPFSISIGPFCLMAVISVPRFCPVYFVISGDALL